MPELEQQFSVIKRVIFVCFFHTFIFSGVDVVFDVLSKLGIITEAGVYMRSGNEKKMREMMDARDVEHYVFYLVIL
jgi:hypothetical protein